MLTVFLAGRGYYSNSRNTVTVKAGMVGLVEPEDVGVLYSSKDDPYEHYYCRFLGPYARHLTARIGESRRSRFGRDPNYLHYAELVRRMGFVPSHRYAEDAAHEMGYREVLLAEILVSVLTRLESTERLRPLNDRTEVLNYLHERIGDRIGVSKMAEDFGVSRNTLMRRMNELFGTSLGRLHERMKMEWAVSLLESGRFTVNEIALRLGYQSSHYFARVFRKNMACSPTQWIRKLVP